MTAWELNDADHELLTREVAPFLPDKIFDAHAHLFLREHYAPEPAPSYLVGNPDTYGLAEYRHYMEWIHPSSHVAGGLFFGLAFNGDRDGNNAFVTSEAARGRQQGLATLAQLIIPPTIDLDELRVQIRDLGVVGLKCYHTMAQVEGPTWRAPIESYLPEPVVAVANEFGLTITLHMVRERAMADPLNQATIRRYCEHYPNMRLILAHAARGFNPWHTIEGIGSLRGLANVYCDTSAVTEAGAFESIVEALGHERLLYGTDFPVSHVRGRCVAIGDSFHWFYADEMRLDELHTTLRPVLIGIESLRSLRLAVQRLHLTDTQIEDIFYHNAARLFGLSAREGT